MKASRKKVKVTISAGKAKETVKSRAKAREYVGYLLELHKLQGVLLTELNKKV
jgi:hypothetical protein